MAIAYVSSLVVFLLVDGLIIVSLGARVYKDTLKDVIADSFHVPPIVFFYLLFAAGLCYFAVAPARRRRAVADCGAAWGDLRSVHLRDVFPDLLRRDHELDAATGRDGPGRRAPPIACIVAVSAYLAGTRF